MDRKVKKLWLEALRNGKYQQGFHKLKDMETGGFCCLGVLCDIHAREVGGCFDDAGYYQGARGVLPPEVVGWSGLSDREGGIPLWGGETLSDLNDSGADFDLIAAIIEHEL